VRKPVSLALVDDAAVGDYVLVHVGYALNRISPEEAERTLALIQQGELEPVAFDADARGAGHEHAIRDEIHRRVPRRRAGPRASPAPSPPRPIRRATTG
jgi:hypothetical protein